MLADQIVAESQILELLDTEHTISMKEQISIKNERSSTRWTTCWLTHNDIFIATTRALHPTHCNKLQKLKMLRFCISRIRPSPVGFALCWIVPCVGASELIHLQHEGIFIFFIKSTYCSYVILYLCSFFSPIRLISVIHQLVPRKVLNLTMKRNCMFWTNNNYYLWKNLTN